jgi:hypothetical protein
MPWLDGLRHSELSVGNIWRWGWMYWCSYKSPRDQVQTRKCISEPSPQEPYTCVQGHLLNAITWGQQINHTMTRHKLSKAKSLTICRQWQLSQWNTYNRTWTRLLQVFILEIRHEKFIQCNNTTCIGSPFLTIVKTILI